MASMHLRGQGDLPIAPWHQAEPLNSTMQLNCKVGDLAVVVSAELSENLGQIVEILAPATGIPFLLVESRQVWQVVTVSGRKTLLYRFNQENGRVDQHSEGPVPDRCLRPVSGLTDGGEEPTGADIGRPARRRRPRVVIDAEVLHP